MSECERAVRRLDQLSSRHIGPDGMLALLVRLSTIPSGMSFPVGLLVDGTIIRGGVVAPEAIAAAVDTTFKEVLTKTSSEMEGEAALHSALDDAFQRALGAERDRQKDARDRLERYTEPWSLDALDPDDVGAFLSSTAPPLGVDLRDAQISIGVHTAHVRVMRVEVSHIAAWWPLTQEEGVNINYVPATSTADSETRTQAE